MKPGTPSPVVPWFGGVPNHWPIKPLGYLVLLSGGSTPSKDRADFWNGDIPWVSPKDMKRWVISDSEDHVAPAALAQTSLGLFQPPVVLIVVRGMILAHTVPVAVTVKSVTINQDMKALLPGPLLTAPFLAYALRAAEPAFLSMVEAAGHGTLCLRTDLWQKLRVAVPPLIEQRTISAYLDRKTAEIDAIVAKKQRMIELLRQERQALISRAVTQGLGATVPMKDSGIPWLGVVPKHWRMVQLKYLSRVQTGITLGKTYSDDTLRFPYLRVANVQDGSLSLSEITEIDVPKSEADRCMLRAGDVLLTEGGDLDKLGRGTVWSGQIPCCLHQNHVFAVRPDPELLLAAFLAYQTKAKHGREYFTLTGQKTTNLASTNTTKVGAFPIPLPSIHEQREICAYIDRETGRIDGLIEKNEQQIAKLREYRQTLISATVTGKFAVPLEETPDFRAAVLAAEIIYSHPATKQIGRTKLHKELYATEHECDLVGIDADYARMPFGPYDDRLQKAVERELEARQWYRAVPGERGKVNYVPLGQAGQHRPYFDRFYGDKAEAIARLVGLLRPLNKNKIERAITLYAAWNDFLIRGEPVDDGRLLTEVQKNWHPEKKHKEESWRGSLAWPKARKLIPHGFGKPTRPTDVMTGLSTAPEDDEGEADDSEVQ